MARKFEELRDKMSPEARAEARTIADEIIAEQRTREDVPTGLVCSACKQSEGIIEDQQPQAIAFRCRACGHRWWYADQGDRTGLEA